MMDEGGEADPGLAQYRISALRRKNGAAVMIRFFWRSGLPAAALILRSACRSGSACLAARRRSRSAAFSYAQMWTQVLSSRNRSS
jgi:hypothetical protein